MKTKTPDRKENKMKAIVKHDFECPNCGLYYVTDEKILIKSSPMYTGATFYCEHCNEKINLILNDETVEF